MIDEGSKGNKRAIQRSYRNWPDEAAGELDLGDSDATAEHEDVVVAALNEGGGELVRDDLVVVVDDDQLALLVLVVKHLPGVWNQDNFIFLYETTMCILQLNYFMTYYYIFNLKLFIKIEHLYEHYLLDHIQNNKAKF